MIRPTMTWPQAAADDARHEPRVPDIAGVQSAGGVGPQVIESIEMNVDCDDPPATGQLAIDQVAADKTAGTRDERSFLGRR